MCCAGGQRAGADAGPAADGPAAVVRLQRSGAVPVVRTEPGRRLPHRRRRQPPRLLRPLRHRPARLSVLPFHCPRNFYDDDLRKKNPKKEIGRRLIRKKMRKENLCNEWEIFEEH